MALSLSPMKKAVFVAVAVVLAPVLLVGVVAMAAGDWRGFDEARAALDLAIRAGRQAAEPYTYQA